jgi:hypothetical protein
MDHQLDRAAKIREQLNQLQGHHREAIVSQDRAKVTDLQKTIDELIRRLNGILALPLASFCREIGEF